MWTSAQTPDFNFSAFTDPIVKSRYLGTYKILFIIGKKRLILVGSYIPKRTCCVNIL